MIFSSVKRWQEKNILPQTLIPFIFFILSLMCFCRTVYAHDPGLSFATLQVQDDILNVQISFAQKDIEYLLAADNNQDGVISQSELELVNTPLLQLIRQGFTLRANEIPVPANKISIYPISIYPATSESIRLDIFYPYQSSAQHSFTLPILEKLSRGHRQHLTVKNSNGSIVLQKILSAKSAPVIIDNTHTHTHTDSVGVLQQYFVEGVWHIWIGFDHILFLLTLLLPAVLVFRNRQWQAVETLLPALMDTLKIVTAFTLAHSITLCLAVFDIVQLPSRLVETVIAISVLVTAINNLWPVFSNSRFLTSRTLLAFGFGLIHGFGFASVLIELGLPDQSLLLSLLGFNLGVETGQLVIVVLLIPLAYLIRHSMLYQHWIFRGGSVAAALIASVWIVERVTTVPMSG